MDMGSVYQALKTSVVFLGLFLYICLGLGVFKFLCVFMVMVALCNRETIYIFILFLFFSSPNLSGHRLDVYHTSIHVWPIVRI